MSTSVPAPVQEKVLLLPYAQALAQLAATDVRVEMLAPPYACAGVGPLRVVRVAERGGVTTLTLSYESYERLE